MKKLLLIGIALVAVLMFAMPAAAQPKVELDGYFRVEGDYQSSPQLDADEDAGGARWRMRLRFGPSLIISDALRIDTRMDIFDGRTFGTLGAKEKNGNNIDFDRAWMTVTTSFGKFAGGRMAGGAWGLTFGNDNEDYDRVRFDTKFGPVSAGVILQKNIEGDWGNSGQVDNDLDAYYLYGLYSADFGKIGLLGAYVNGKHVTTSDYTKYALAPYFDLNFGMIGVRGELGWETGETDPDAAGARTTDIDALEWMLEADATFGPFTVTAGYAWVQGQDRDPYTDSEANKSYGGIGDDWDLLVVLMDVDTFINGHAGGSFPSGVKLWYGQAAWKASKDLKFWATIGGAEAETLDTLPSGTDKKMGTEYDINAQWNVMKNLKFLFRFGYLDAGDFWKQGDSTFKIDNTMSAYQQWTLSF